MSEPRCIIGFEHIEGVRQGDYLRVYHLDNLRIDDIRVTRVRSDGIDARKTASELPWLEWLLSRIENYWTYPVMNLWWRWTNG